jgi:CRP-like cAMP-binding protein
MFVSWARFWSTINCFVVRVSANPLENLSGPNHHRREHVAPVENQLIARLPRPSRSRLLELCEPVQLRFSEVICVGGKPLQHVYFPRSGFVSLLTMLDDEPALEVGMVGSEGMLGAQMALGVIHEPLRAIVQGRGPSWRIEVLPFRRELQNNPALQQSLRRYLHVMMTQLAGSAACLQFHRPGPRLARWLLMTQDRAQSDRLELTHEFLSYMLGVRRVSITIAAARLQRQGLVEYERGNIRILNRSRLKKAACSCYATDQKTYAELLN